MAVRIFDRVLQPVLSSGNRGQAHEDFVAVLLSAAPCTAGLVPAGRRTQAARPKQR